MRFPIIAALLLVSLVSRVATAIDTDGDGLLDLIDVPGFDPNAIGDVIFAGFGIQDLDGVNLLTKATSLSLNGNQITSVESGDFDGLTNLLELDLANNQITSIDSGDFDGLDNLQNLFLLGNQISSIKRGDFDGLANLQTLDLPNNQITSIQSDAFQRLTTLKYLGLQNNRLTSIENGVFDGLANLLTLWLAGNQVSTIASGAFREMGKLGTLILRNNPFVELNLSQSTLTSLSTCNRLFGGVAGFCLVKNDVWSLVLDGARLSSGSFDVVLSETTSIQNASLIGLMFFDQHPQNLAQLLGISSLNSIRVDDSLYALYAAEFDAWDSIDGHTLEIIALIPGDYNGNGKVDAADYTVWKDIYGSTTNLIADGNANGVIDAADYTVWKDNFGQSGEAWLATSTIPEPSALVLWGILAFALPIFRPRR
ncbi:MAG: leucine-rich repeat domain-containing protein [Pirellulaceae bacterium]